MAVVLLVAVLLFEIDIRVNGWKRAEPSPYFDAAKNSRPRLASACRAFVVCRADARAVDRGCRPSIASSATAERLGRISQWRPARMRAAIGIVMTAVTGWLFYWLAFVAE
jgi:hypothetical protein